MQFRFHTKALLYNPEGKILVLQRADTEKRDLLGGKTELPEKIEEAILREIQEETGIKSVEKLKKDAENPQRILIPLYGTGCRFYL